MKIKDIIEQPGSTPNSEGSAKVIIEEDGVEYTFSARMGHILDDKMFVNLCGVWKRDIEEKKKYKKISKTTKATKIKALKGKEIKL